MTTAAKPKARTRLEVLAEQGQAHGRKCEAAMRAIQAIRRDTNVDAMHALTSLRDLRDQIDVEIDLLLFAGVPDDGDINGPFWKAD